MELTVLRSAGIWMFQGYYFAKPAFMGLPEVPMLHRILGSFGETREPR